MAEAANFVNEARARSTIRRQTEQIVRLRAALREIETKLGAYTGRVPDEMNEAYLIARAALSEQDELTSMDIDDEGNLLSTPDE